jgi:hypothetical protein
MQESPLNDNSAWATILQKISDRDILLKEFLTRRSGGLTTSAILSTNIGAWRKPDAYPNDVAVILPDRILSKSGFVYVGMRFNGEVVIFQGL